MKDHEDIREVCEKFVPYSNSPDRYGPITLSEFKMWILEPWENADLSVGVLARKDPAILISPYCNVPILAGCWGKDRYVVYAKFDHDREWIPGSAVVIRVDYPDEWEG